MGAPARLKVHTTRPKAPDGKEVDLIVQAGESNELPKVRGLTQELIATESQENVA